MRSKIYLAMAALILAALAVPAAAQKQAPSKGAFQGKDTVTPPTIAFAGTGASAPSWSILTLPRNYGRHPDHVHRVCSLVGGQWEQHLFDIRRIVPL